ncbi:MAG TPA: hypothetical protein PLV32_10600, partial [Chitinophagaceae bacterium]|nr:hypothetical protein [Chitinophagaceae bacterium]
ERRLRVKKSATGNRNDATSPLCAQWFPDTSEHLNFDQQSGQSPGKLKQSTCKSKHHRSPVDQRF